jgi:phosphohistidine swiveling domain-containing protein
LNYIYKWEIKWTITDIKNFDYKKNNQILISQDLNFELYDKLENISWVIIKKWNKLSHNSIIFREYKIPSVINYDDFDSLKIWNEISLK